jgi:hypothetical protein
MFSVSVNAELAGDVQGLSLLLGWDPAVTEPVSVEPGALLARQAAPALALSSEPGNVDVVALGTGATLAGSGELARVTFRVRAAGNPALAIRTADARGADNGRLALDGDRPAGTPESAVARTSLGIAFPNPFSDAMTIHWSVARAEQVTLSVFDVSGRRVRTLVHGVAEPGSYLARWDGRGDSGARMAPGFYVIRLEAGALVQTKHVRLVR